LFREQYEVQTFVLALDQFKLLNINLEFEHANQLAHGGGSNSKEFSRQVLEPSNPDYHLVGYILHYGEREKGEKYKTSGHWTAVTLFNNALWYIDSILRKGSPDIFEFGSTRSKPSPSLEASKSSFLAFLNDKKRKGHDPFLHRVVVHVNSIENLMNLRHRYFKVMKKRSNDKSLLYQNSRVKIPSYDIFANVLGRLNKRKSKIRHPSKLKIRIPINKSRTRSQSVPS